MPNPKSPRTPIVHILGPKYLDGDYVKAKFYTYMDTWTLRGNVGRKVLTLLKLTVFLAPGAPSA